MPWCKKCQYDDGTLHVHDYVPPAKTGSYVFVALTEHEARALVLAIDEAINAEAWPGTLKSVREDVMDGLASLAREKRALTSERREA